jgi:hypothetical protein
MVAWILKGFSEQLGYLLKNNVHHDTEYEKITRSQIGFV